MIHPLRASCLLFAALLPWAGRADVSPVVVPRAHQPGSGQILYFVLTDRFANGSPANDRGGIAGGREQHGFDPTAIGYYHGGDFAGLAAHLDYIQNLGATAIWVTPPFRNKAVQSGSAGYHGYWITDFLHIDPHLGTDAEFQEFVRQAHARGLRVVMDIIVNHTADVIAYRDGTTTYRSRVAAPYRDAGGKPFDERALAYNGIGSPDGFPVLSVERSFPHVPVVSEVERQVKNPAWLNDLTLYHNRGNSSFKGEDSLYGDFVGLDDLFTENPKVVRGFIDVYAHWIETAGVDGFRIDTAKHVNKEFWQAFSPAIRARARQAGKPEFFSFGEVADDGGDVPFLSEFTTEATLDAILDFGFFGAARDFVSRGLPAAKLAEFFARDDYYTDHDSNAYSAPTFLGNHDAGRFGLFLKQDNPSAPDGQLLGLMELGHALLLLSRGQPVVYYGDEQGMTGYGNDMAAREDMFPSQSEPYRRLALIGNKRTGADEKFDPSHPLYRTIHALATLRSTEPALRNGAMLVRKTDKPAVFAFSRIDRSEKIEFIVALNNSRTETVQALVPTAQPSGAAFSLVLDSRGTAPADSAEVTADAAGRVSLSLAPLQYAVWKAKSPLVSRVPAPTIMWKTPRAGATVRLVPSTRDGQTFAGRAELSCEVAGVDGIAEVTFALRRASHPDEYLYLGTDDAPPYRVFWTPPADLGTDESVTFLATVDDLRGHRATTTLEGVKLVIEGGAHGIRGSTAPHFSRLPPPLSEVRLGAALRLEAAAAGTGELEYQWLRDGDPIPGATSAVLAIERCNLNDSGNYTVLVHDLAGSVVSRPIQVTVHD